MTENITDFDMACASPLEHALLGVNRDMRSKWRTPVEQLAGIKAAFVALGRPLINAESRKQATEDILDIARDVGLVEQVGEGAVHVAIASALREVGPGPPPTGPVSRPVRLALVPFDDVKLQTEQRHLVKGLLPATGLVVVWGPPKCGKSFWVTDATLHVAAGWKYRGRRVRQGPVVYCAMEGASGYGARLEAFRQRHLTEGETAIPFYLVAAPMVLVRDHGALVDAITATLAEQKPVAIVLDTLNRSIGGSESDDRDMSSYIAAADALWAEFDCATIIVHHCGIDASRPRGHTSLTGAADAQLSVKRDPAGNIVVTVEYLKDGPEGDTIVSRLEQVEVGTDEDGEQITSCVVVPVDGAPVATASEHRLTKNQQTMFALLHAAGAAGLSTEEWNRQARDAGLGVRRRADLHDLQAALKSKGLIRQFGDRWTVAQP